MKPRMHVRIWAGGWRWFGEYRGKEYDLGWAEEAGALDALFGYDIEAFIQTFYKEMGRAYLEPYEKGLRSLAESRGFLSGALRRAARARKAFEEA